MLFIPAWVWRGGPAYRAVCVGIPAGVFFAALAFAESGIVLGALVVFVVTGPLNGIVMARRMAKLWPAARDLSPGERVEVSSAARRGKHIAEARLAPAAIEYVGALRHALEHARRWQWLVWLLGAAALALAVFDTLSGTPRVAAVSWLYVVFFAVEIAWWPGAQDRLAANAGRTGESARQALSQ